MVRRLPALQVAGELLRRLLAGAVKEVAGVHALGRQNGHAVLVDGHEPDGRVRQLQRLSRHVHLLIAMELAMKIEGLGAEEGFLQQVHGFHGPVGPGVPIGLVDPEFLGSDPCREADFKAAMGHVIEDDCFFHDAHGVVQCRGVAHWAKVDPLGAGSGRSAVGGRLGTEPLEVVDGREAVVEPHLVAEGQLAPELVVPLRCRFPLAGKDLAEMGEFHRAALVPSVRFSPVRWGSISCSSSRRLSLRSSGWRRGCWPAPRRA